MRTDVKHLNERSVLNKTTGHLFHKRNEGVFHKTNRSEWIERTEVCRFYAFCLFVWLFAIQL